MHKYILKGQELVEGIEPYTVNAEKITDLTAIVGIEQSESAKLGDYVVANQIGHKVCVAADEFEKHYELLDE